MPNRIIKESICDSEKVSRMTDFQFRLWIGLITQADDAGRGDARPAILKGRIFPLRDQVTSKQIYDAMRELATIGSVVLYEVDGKPYYAHKNWSDHQRIRDVKPKYPAPEDGLCQSAADCGNPPQTAADCGYNPIQSESESESNPKESAGKPRRFTPPTLEDVTDYCEERKNGIDPQRFLDFYEAKGWKVGNQAMKDWKACVRTWEGREKAQPKKPQKYTTAAEYERSPETRETKMVEFLKSIQKEDDR